MPTNHVSLNFVVDYQYCHHSQFMNELMEKKFISHSFHVPVISFPNWDQNLWIKTAQDLLHSPVEFIEIYSFYFDMKAPVECYWVGGWGHRKGKGSCYRRF